MSVQQENSKAFTIFIFITALICGGLVMVIEVMGSRIIGPFFGVSLFVWTSLISVTLVALALGYAAGGYFADRFPSPKYLYSLIMISGLLTLLVPWVQGGVLQMCVPLGLRLGAFASTLILFGPALFLLGCVSPYLVRIAASQLGNIGRLVGGLYALSTIGSTVGTVITGFVLVAYMGVSNIFLTTGIVLVLLSVIYFTAFHRKVTENLLIIVPVILAGSLFSPVMQKEDRFSFKTKTLPGGSELTQVYHTESFYGTIKVVDSKSVEKHSRYMMIDSMIQGGIDVRENNLSIFFYNYYLQFIPYMLHPDGKTCAVIGLGAGLVSRWYEDQGMVCDIVDIDEKVIDVAKEYFDFSNKGEVITEDGRYFLKTSNKLYDYLILDVFNGDITPAHLLSLEALTSQKQRLTEKGVLAVNLIGSLTDRPFMTASVVKTLEQVFDQVEIYPAFDVEKSNGMGNVIVVAYQGASRKFQKVDQDIYTMHPFFEQEIKANLGKRFYFPADTQAIVLTDDYNPIDFYDYWLRELIRTRILETVDWDLLAG